MRRYFTKEKCQMANKYERMIIVASHQGNAVYTILCTSNLQRQKENTQ